jgi:hypothetical protein
MQGFVTNSVKEIAEERRRSKEENMRVKFIKSTITKSGDKQQAWPNNSQVSKRLRLMRYANTRKYSEPNTARKSHLTAMEATVDSNISLLLPESLAKNISESGVLQYKP